MKKEINPNKLSSYYERVKTIAKNSHDAETKVGAILIHPVSGAQIADGYNGFIRGALDSSLPNKRPEKYEYIKHAEENLISNAARHGIATDGCIVFCSLSPCIRCIRLLYQCGINIIYFKEKYSDFEHCSNMKDMEIHVEEINGFYKLSTFPKKEF